MPIPDLIASIQKLTAQLYGALTVHAADEGAYQRAFWAHWQTLAPDMSVAAQNRQCEWKCSALDEERIVSRGLVEANEGWASRSRCSPSWAPSGAASEPLQTRPCRANRPRTSGRAHPHRRLSPRATCYDNSFTSLAEPKLSALGRCSRDAGVSTFCCRAAPKAGQGLGPAPRPGGVAVDSALTSPGGLHVGVLDRVRRQPRPLVGRSTSLVLIFEADDGIDARTKAYFRRARCPLESSIAILANSPGTTQAGIFGSAIPDVDAHDRGRDVEPCPRASVFPWPGSTTTPMGTPTAISTFVYPRDPLAPTSFAVQDPSSSQGQLGDRPGHLLSGRG